jgi:hypothetical protein
MFQTSGDHFFAGLPCSYFREKLKWEGFSPFPVLDERGLARNSQSDSNRHYPFPSWSWLAWKSQTIPFTQHEGYRRELVFYRLDLGKFILIHDEDTHHRRRNWEYGRDETKWSAS